MAVIGNLELLKETLKEIDLDKLKCALKGHPIVLDLAEKGVDFYIKGLMDNLQMAEEMRKFIQILKISLSGGWRTWFAVRKF